MNRSVSNQLYHFTGYDKETEKFKPDEDAFEILQKILESRYLRLSTNLVEVHLPQGKNLGAMKIGVKMACLTETPLEFISEHIDKYGKFGLGFTVEWALENGGLSVIYIDRKNPNSFSYMMSELGDFFMRNGMLGHDLTALSLMVQLTAMTERFELRHEREWRFFRATNMPDGTFAVPFSANDLQTIICPSEYVAKIKENLSKMGISPEVITTEQAWDPK